MNMTDRVPDWITPIAWLFIALALLSAAAIAYDIYGRRHRHHHLAGELVWITSALYLGPFALPAYARFGRTSAGLTGTTETDRLHGAQPVAVAGLPGGGASAVAHVIGVPLVIASGLTIAGISLWVMILVIAVLATGLLFAHERVADHRAGVLSLGAALGAAAVTVLAFDVGMGGWMLLLHFNELMPPATEGAFWFLMQIGIVLGLLTGYPVVKWLTRRDAPVRLTAG